MNHYLAEIAEAMANEGKEKFDVDFIVIAILGNDMVSARTLDQHETQSILESILEDVDGEVRDSLERN